MNGDAATTADLLDVNEDAQVCILRLRSFGAPSFFGPVATLRCFEDNALVKGRLSCPGEGRVLDTDIFYWWAVKDSNKRASRGRPIPESETGPRTTTDWKASGK
jgi:hypothetical protein